MNAARLFLARRVFEVCSLLTALAAAGASAQDIPPMEPQDRAFLALFQKGEYRYTGGGYQDKVFRYRLFVPSVPKNEKRPLIIWLHGHGEGGNDNTVHLRWLDRLIMPPPWEPERFGFFVFALQCIEGNGNWTTSDPAQDNMVDVAAEIVEELVSKYPIDTDRVYLAGVSSGGTGCWEYAVRHPERIAAMMPFSSGGTNHPELRRLVDIPIWVFHSSDDKKPPVEVIRKTVAELRQLGGTVALTEIATGDHDCWTAAFQRYDVWDWLLGQRRGQTSWSTSPQFFAARSEFFHFCETWRWWQILLQVGIPLAAMLLGWRAVRRRRLGAAATRQTISSVI